MNIEQLRLKGQEHRHAARLLALTSYVEHNQKLTPSERKLRDNQMTAFEALRDKLESGKVVDRGHFHIPSGTENLLFAELTDVLHTKTLIVAENIYAVMRMEDELKALGKDVDLGRVFGGEKEYHHLYTITTYSAFLHDKEIKPKAYGLVLLLQADRLLTPKRKARLEPFTNALKIGATVAPKYSEEKQLEQVLPPRIHKESTKDAAKDGYLSSFTTYTTDLDADVSNVTVTADGDYDDRELSQALNTGSLNKATVDIYKRNRFVNRQAIAYCVDVDHAEKLAKSFKEAGFPADVLSGKQSRSQQRESRRRFRTGEIKVLCNTNIIVEEPKAEVCLNIRPTLSQVRAELRGGGVLPNDPDNPAKHAYIIDFIPTKRRANKPILYADIVEETAHGLVSTGGGDSLERQFSNIEVQGIQVQTQLNEILSVFDDLVRKDSLQLTTLLSIDALRTLLDKDPETIAARLPFYFKGNVRQVTEAVKNPLTAFANYTSENNQDITLPTDVIERMFLDSIYEKLYGQEIVAAIPNNVAQFAKISQPCLEFFPYLQEKVSILTDLSESAVQKVSNGFVDESMLVERFSREMDDIDAYCRLLQLPPDAYERRTVQLSFQKIKEELRLYKEEDVKSIRKKRMQQFMKQTPTEFVDLITSGHGYDISEVVQETADLANPEQVRNKIDETCASIAMNNRVKGNILSFVNTFPRRIMNSPDLESIQNSARTFEQISFLVRRITDSGEHSQKLQPYNVQISDRIYEETEKLFRMITRSLDADQTFSLFNTMEISELENLRALLGTQLTNRTVIRNEVKNGLAIQPKILSDYSESVDPEETILIQTIQKHSHYTKK